MHYAFTAFLFAGGLFLGMLLLLEVGRRAGHRRLLRDPEGTRSGGGAIEGAVLALMGLLIAFTFSGAATRFDSRRQLIIDETNAVSTAYLRLDVLPEGPRSELRGLFLRYLESRLEVYRRIPDMPAVYEELSRSNGYQQQIWSKAVAACQAEASPMAGTLLLPALNQMFDLATTRTMATRMHPPAIIYAMLGLVVLTSALLCGFAMSEGVSRRWVHMLGFAAILAIALYVTLDLEHPRLGFIRVDEFDQALADLLKSM